VRLFLDEMLSSAIAEQLRSRGVDVEAVDERPDLRSSPDLDLFEHAQREARAIVTYDRDDFLTLDRRYRDEGRDHNGIVIVNVRRFPQAAATTGALVDSLEALLHRGPPYAGFVHWLQ
jgi:predicted nuclease of predicted toxin-antitoxin system